MSDVGLFTYGNGADVGEAINEIKNLREDDAYRYYTGITPDLSKMFLSPFHKETKPSFKFYQSQNGNRKYYFQCFSTGGRGDIISLIMQLYSCSYNQAIKRIVKDGFAKGFFDSSEKLPKKNSLNTQQNSIKEKTDIVIVPREFTEKDLSYWNQYGLDEKFLLSHNVMPCKEVWYTNKRYGLVKWIGGNNIPVYRYLFGDRYKVYNPTNYKGVGKWLSNTHNRIIQGLQYIPETGDKLIITKSYKDVLVLLKQFNIPSIAFQSEQIVPSIQSINYFKDRFKEVILFYDNDAPGLDASKRFSDIHNIESVHIDIELKSKDASDLYRDYSVAVFKDVIKNMLKI